jgi:hypothetical protein
LIGKVLYQILTSWAPAAKALVREVIVTALVAVTLKQIPVEPLPPVKVGTVLKVKLLPQKGKREMSAKVKSSLLFILVLLSFK